MKTTQIILLIAGFILLISVTSFSQVLGPCGAPPEAEKEATASKQDASQSKSAMVVSPIPLPGQRALDFELPAVVGDEIKNIKLSDYQGKWRVVCFFPAAFTFV
jgi:hypothetical protein